MKRIVIFGNGKLHKKFLREIRVGDYVIGVDRAAYWLIKHHIMPQVAIGDFDSTTKQEWEHIQKSVNVVKRYPKEKNWTDMELALMFAQDLGIKDVYIFGGTGTRLDHTLATLHLLDNQILVDECNKMRLVGRGKTDIERTSYRYISILPYTKSIMLTLTGFKYNLTRKRLQKGETLGISNELAAPRGTIHIFSGRAWVIESND